MKEYYGTISRDDDREMTFLVDEYHIGDNLVEAIIETGDYGYSAELRDIDSGNKTYQKQPDETEVLPFYFLFWIPETAAGEFYENGERGIAIFQQINRMGIKTGFHKRIQPIIFGDEDDNLGEDTMMEMYPITSQNLLRKLINAERVLRAEFELDDLPPDEESRMQFAEGIDTRETDRHSYVLKPEHGGSLDEFKEKAQDLMNRANPLTDGGSSESRDSNATFAQIVSEEVFDLTVKIEKENGRQQTLSLLDDEIKMREELDEDMLDLQQGLPTTDSICVSATNLVNQILEDSTCELEHTTELN
jgi:hypothetical protein